MVMPKSAARLRTDQATTESRAHAKHTIDVLGAGRDSVILPRRMLSRKHAAEAGSTTMTVGRLLP
jgi:hypothetical protein